MKIVYAHVVTFAVVETFEQALFMWYYYARKY